MLLRVLLHRRQLRLVAVDHRDARHGGVDAIVPRGRPAQRPDRLADARARWVAHVGAERRHRARAEGDHGADRPVGPQGARLAQRDRRRVVGDEAAVGEPLRRRLAPPPLLERGSRCLARLVVKMLLLLLLLLLLLWGWRHACSHRVVARRVHEQRSPLRAAAAAAAAAASSPSVMSVIVARPSCSSSSS